MRLQGFRVGWFREDGENPWSKGLSIQLSGGLTVSGQQNDVYVPGSPDVASNMAECQRRLFPIDHDTIFLFTTVSIGCLG